MTINQPEYVTGRQMLAGKRIVITAAAGTGIGSAVARRCAEEGAEALLISDLHERRLKERAEEIAAECDITPEIALCDVTRQEDVDGLMDVARQRLSRVDVLINNAGLGGKSDLVDMSDEEWHKVIDVTLNGSFRMTRAMLCLMREQGQGVIVNNASVLGWRAQRGQAHYAAAKAGVMALTRCAAVEAAAYGVRINAVAPSLAMHPFLNRVTPQEELDELQKREAFGRAAETWEVANVMIFLASGYSSYMTGETISVSSQRA